MKAKKYKCDPMTMPASYNEFNSYSADDLKKFEESSGYSEYAQQTDGKDIFEISCKKPVSYKLITTKKQALCHKFMTDNKLL